MDTRNLFTKMSRKKTMKFDTMVTIDRYEDVRKLEYHINFLEYAGQFLTMDMLKAAMAYLTENQKQRLWRDLVRLARQCGIESEHTKKTALLMDGEVTESIVGLCRYQMLDRATLKKILPIMKGLLRKAAPDTSGNSLAERVRELGRLFNFNEIEEQIVTFLFLVTYDQDVDQLYDRMRDFLKAKYYLMAKAVALLVGLPRYAVEKEVGQGSNIIKFKLVDASGCLEDEVVSYLAGSSGAPLSETYYSIYTGRTFPLESYMVGDRHAATVRELIAQRPADRGLNILLYGRPGIGKTEFARSLGRELGLTVYEVKNAATDGKDHESSMFFRFRALAVCRKMTTGKKTLIMVDEADALLNTNAYGWFGHSVMEKSHVNSMLDDGQGVVVWITNRFNDMDESTRRRFDYSIEFEKMTYQQRLNMWRTGVNKYDLAACLSDQELETLATTCEMSAGGIDIALRHAGTAHQAGKSKPEIIQLVKNLTQAHLKMMDPQQQRRELQGPETKQFRPEALNIKSGIERVMPVIEQFSRSWTAEGEGMPVRNLNLLLYGPPGTGKTEFAKYVARQTKRRLVIKRVSDLSSCWVGETEKNIRQAFIEAERDAAILFLDEADSFLGSRESAQRSWEITEVNEVLTNMETFRGMLICATNFRRIVDSAAIRRFAFKLEFDYLTRDGICLLYETLLAGLPPEPLQASDLAQLESLRNVAPGDFKVVCQTHSFFNRADLSHAMLIQALAAEVRARKEKDGVKVGFKACAC